MNDYDTTSHCKSDFCSKVSRRAVLGGAVATPFALTLANAKSRSASAQDGDSGTLTVAVRNPICGLDPFQICGYPSGPAVLYIIANRLTKVDLDLELLPDLAESWEVSDDGLTWTMHLRQDVVFQDGTPFTSQAIQAHFDHARDPELAFTTSVLFPQIVSIELPDEHTVVFGLERPFGAFLTNMAVYTRAILSPAVYEQYDAADVALHPIGTGRYRVTEFEPNVELVLERSDTYFGEPAPLDRMVFIPSPEASSRANLLRTGQVDVAEDIPIEELADLESDPNVRIIQKRSLYVFGINFNIDIPPFDDVRVRQALNYALDKQLLVDAIFGGAASVLDSPLAEPIVGHTSVGVYEFDPDRAITLLNEAGWMDDDGDGIVEKDGQPLRPTLVYQEAALRAAEVVQAIQGDFRNIGVDLQLQLIEQSAWAGTVLTEHGNLTAEMQMTSFNPSDGDALRQLGYMFATNGDPEGVPDGGNWGWYSNPAVDAALLEAGQVIDQSDRLEPLATAQTLLMEDCPWIWLYAPDLLVGVRSNVQGVDVFPMSFLDLLNASKSQ